MKEKQILFVFTLFSGDWNSKEKIELESDSRKCFVLWWKCPENWWNLNEYGFNWCIIIFALTYRTRLEKIRPIIHYYIIFLFVSFYLYAYCVCSTENNNFRNIFVEKLFKSFMNVSLPFLQIKSPGEKTTGRSRNTNSHRKPASVFWNISTRFKVSKWTFIAISAWKCSKWKWKKRKKESIKFNEKIFNENSKHPNVWNVQNENNEETRR